MYSQNKEEETILGYWQTKSDGRLLDIGAYDGKTFSNTKALLDRGWSGVMVEASPRCFSDLMKTYAGNDRVHLVNALVGHGVGLVEFHDSMGACATTDKVIFDRWAPHQKDYQTIFSPVMDADLLFEKFGYDFDFISIDCEGMDYSILQRVPVGKMPRLKMLCIEYGKDGEMIHRYMEGCSGFRPIMVNAENVIYAKL